MAKMMTSFAFSCLSHHRGVIGDAETPRFSCSQRSHGTPGPKSPARRPTHRSTPTRSQAGDLVGKYGGDRYAETPSFPAVDDHTEHRVLVSRLTTDPPFHPPPGDSTLGSSVPHSPPRSESKGPVERPSSSDTGHSPVSDERVGSAVTGQLTSVL